MCVVLVTQWCPTPCDPMDRLPGSSVHGILQARILEWVAIPFSRGSSWPRDWTCISCLLHWQVGSLSLVLPGKPIHSSIGGQIFPTFLYYKKYCNEHVSSYICVKICLARVALNGTDGSQDILHPVMHPLPGLDQSVSRPRPLLMGNASPHLIPHQTAWVPISCVEGIYQSMKAAEWWLLQRLVDSKLRPQHYTSSTLSDE